MNDPRKSGSDGEVEVRQQGGSDFLRSREDLPADAGSGLSLSRNEQKALFPFMRSYTGSRIAQISLGLRRTCKDRSQSSDPLRPTYRTPKAFSSPLIVAAATAGTARARAGVSDGAAMDQIDETMDVTFDVNDGGESSDIVKYALQFQPVSLAIQLDHSDIINSLSRLDEGCRGHLAQSFHYAVIHKIFETYEHGIASFVFVVISKYAQHQKAFCREMRGRWIRNKLKQSSAARSIHTL